MAFRLKFVGSSFNPMSLIFSFSYFITFCLYKVDRVCIKISLFNIFFQIVEYEINRTINNFPCIIAPCFFFEKLFLNVIKFSTNSECGVTNAIQFLGFRNKREKYYINTNFPASLNNETIIKSEPKIRLVLFFRVLSFV